jgi:hypothetical protein
MLKCWCFNCEEVIEGGKDFCPTHEEKLGKFCEVCNQLLEKQENQLMGPHIDIMFKRKNFPLIMQKLQEKLPTQFQAEISRLMSQFKSSTDEQKSFEKARKVMEDFFIKKGGKRTNPIKYWICSNCSSESTELQRAYLDKNPDFKILMTKILEGENEMDKFFDKVQEELSQEEVKKIGKEIEEVMQNNSGPTVPGNGPTNDNSAEIARLQQEILRLQNQITDLGNNNPDSPNFNNEEIERVKNELEETKRKLAEFSRNKSPGSPAKTPENSNLPLYLSLAVIGIIAVAFLSFFLISAKKKKKKMNLDTSLKNIKYAYPK